MKNLVVALALTVALCAAAFADDLYEDYHGGFGSGLWRGMPFKPQGYGPQPWRSLNPLVQQGLGDYDHDGMFDKFDFDSDNDGMLNRFDGDPYDSRGW